MKELKVTVYCDRCNREVKSYYAPVKNVEILEADEDDNENKNNIISAELCSECFASFEQWMNGSRCKDCEYYDGKLDTALAAPCKFYKGIMTSWNKTCRNFKEYKK